MQVVVLADTSAPPSSSDGGALAALSLVAGRPFVDWQLDRFVESGARSVVMCVGWRGEELETHVRRALDRGLTVGYSYAGEQPPGTGGALRRAFARLDDDFVVTYGDRYVPFDYSAPLSDLRDHPEALATLVVTEGQGRITVEGDWVTAYEGPALSAFADAGVVALRRAALADIEDGAVWPLSALLRRLSRTRKLRALRLRERVYAAGDPGLASALGRSSQLA
jgi:N-acetyl-alpha-D-muramate 1-phosphate uridylyltransferase